MVRIQIPYHLQNLSGAGSEVELDLSGPLTVKDVIRALEARYPMLKGAVLDHENGARRPKIRFFACGEDVSHEPDEFVLPEAVSEGREPLMIVGAISGG